MSDSKLRSKLVRLAHANPELREHLLPLLKEAGVPEDHQLKILKDTVKNPLKGKFLGGPSAEEAEKTLREKFKFTDKQIDALKKSASEKVAASAINYARDIKVNAMELVSTLQAPKTVEGSFLGDMAFAHVVKACALYAKMILRNPSLTKLLLRAEEMVLNIATGEAPTMTDEPTSEPVFYLWSWAGGGWNGAWARSEAEAISKAKEMEGNSPNLKLVPGSVHRAQPGEEEHLIAMDR